MTYTDLKTEILSRLKKLELCAAYQQALLATDNNGLLAAAIDLFIWTYKTGVVDDTLIEEFTDGELNAYGIYKNGATITNPTTDIYLFKGGSSTIIVNGDHKLNLFIAGASVVDITAINNAYVEIKSYDDAVVDAAISNYAMCKITCGQRSAFTLVANNNAVAHINIGDYSQLDYTGNNDTYALIKGYNHSAITYAVNDAAIAEVKVYNQATINSPII